MAAAIVTRRMVLGGMAAAALPTSLRHAHAAQSLMPEPVAVPAGAFLYGSTPGQRRLAYALDERAYGHARTREMGWYDNEPPLTEGRTGAFEIASTPVTNRQYGAFLRATGHPPPDVDPRTWAGYGLIHPYERTRRHAWSDAHTPPPGRLDHPVVLVAHADARAYARWLSAETGVRWRLPDEREWEKAARGTDGRRMGGVAAQQPRRGTLRHAAGGPLPRGRQPLRDARRRRAGVRVDGDTGGRGALHRQGRLLGRQRLRHLPARRAPRPASRHPPYPDRLPAAARGAGRLIPRRRAGGQTARPRSSRARAGGMAPISSPVKTCIVSRSRSTTA